MAEAKKDPSANGGREPGSLATLKNCFPAFTEAIVNQRVLDYACGYGDQARAMAYAGAKQVTGYDVSRYALEKARELTPARLGEEVRFTDDLNGLGQFDVVVCQNSFEHFLSPESELGKMLYAVKPDGALLLTFGPPWHSPWGAHMDAWCRLPWFQNWPFRLLFTENVVMRVRQTFRTDERGPKWFYRDVGLGQMTIRRFEAMLAKGDFYIPYRRYSCCWGVDFLQHIPFLREWFINHVSVVVMKRVPNGRLK